MSAGPDCSTPLRAGSGDRQQLADEADRAMTHQPTRSASHDLREIRSAWILHLSALGILLALLGVLYHHAIGSAVEVWWVSPTYSHCFLILPISAYLIWLRRERLARLIPVVFLQSLVLMLPLILVSLAGALASINEVEQLAFVGFVQVLVLALLGRDIYRAILFPCLFLFFLIPMGEYLIGPLQTFTTHFIDAGLNVLGIAHYTEGNFIQLDNGQYEVAEACAGLRFLIATVVVGVLFAYFNFRKWHKIALYLLASAIVPVIANGFRTLGIILLAHWTDNKVATGADHLVYGWGFSVVILLALMFVGSRFADDMQADKGGEVTAPPRQPLHRSALTALAALVAICVVPALLYWQEHRPIKLDLAAFSAPPATAGWSIGKLDGHWAPLFADPDAKLAFAMHDAAPFTPVVDVFVDYYATGREGHRLIASTNKFWDEALWHPVSQGGADAMIGGETVRFGELVITSPIERRLIWWTYWADGRFTTSATRVKLSSLKTALLGHGGACLVAASTPVEADLDGARTRLRRALEAMGTLPALLENVAKPGSGR